MIREVQEMVASLHRAGLEVILDVVYNHTCEVVLGGSTCPGAGWMHRGITCTMGPPQRSSLMSLGVGTLLISRIRALCNLRWIRCGIG